MTSLTSLGDWAWQLIREIVPEANRDTSCLYFAMAAARAAGTGWRFAAGGAYLPSSGMCGWGLSVSPRDLTYVVTADHAVSDDGSYCGHCWVQSTGRHYPAILDIHDAYSGPRTEIDRLIVYHAIPSLTRSIKQHYAATLAVIARRARRDAAFTQAIRVATQQAQQAVLAALH